MCLMSRYSAQPPCEMSRIADFLLRTVTVGAGNRAARPERRQGAHGFGVRLYTFRQTAGPRPYITPVDPSPRSDRWGRPAVLEALPACSTSTATVHAGRVAERQIRPSSQPRAARSSRDNATERYCL